MRIFSFKNFYVYENLKNTVTSVALSELTACHLYIQPKSKIKQTNKKKYSEFVWHEIEITSADQQCLWTELASDVCLAIFVAIFSYLDENFEKRSIMHHVID